MERINFSVSTVLGLLNPGTSVFAYLPWNTRQREITILKSIDFRWRTGPEKQNRSVCVKFLQRETTRRSSGLCRDWRAADHRSAAFLRRGRTWLYPRRTACGRRVSGDFPDAPACVWSMRGGQSSLDNLQTGVSSIQGFLQSPKQDMFFLNMQLEWTVVESNLQWYPKWSLAEILSQFCSGNDEMVLIHGELNTVL